MHLIEIPEPYYYNFYKNNQPIKKQFHNVMNCKLIGGFTKNVYSLLLKNN